MAGSNGALPTAGSCDRTADPPIEHHHHWWTIGAMSAAPVPVPRSTAIYEGRKAAQTTVNLKSSGAGVAAVASAANSGAEAATQEAMDAAKWKPPAFALKPSGAHLMSTVEKEATELLKDAAEAANPAPEVRDPEEEDAEKQLLLRGPLTEAQRTKMLARSQTGSDRC